MNVFLIGLMGSGKTFWADKLSAVSNIPVFDLDKQIEKAENKTIAEIFAENGEAYFRGKENEILKSFAAKNNFILSTGGGAPCFYDNMEWMNERGITIWIDEPPGTIAKRLQKEKLHRPLIANVTDEALPGFFVQMREKRKSFYAKAKYHLTGSAITVENLLKIISPNE